MVCGRKLKCFSICNIDFLARKLRILFNFMQSHCRTKVSVNDWIGQKFTLIGKDRAISFCSKRLDSVMIYRTSCGALVETFLRRLSIRCGKNLWIKKYAADGSDLLFRRAAISLYLHRTANACSVKTENRQQLRLPLF